VIATKEILTIHSILIDRFGGVHGVRDMLFLESALVRPFQTYDSTDLYSGCLEKAAALVESLLINHPFVDGNKRTGYTVLRLFLMQNGLDLIASQPSRYDFIIAVASGKLKYEAILGWLAEHTGSPQSWVL
jgi:death on curing protein